MKKFLLSLAALFTVSAVAVALPNSTILLQHRGNVVHYPLDSLNAALRDAVDGDTLFLSKGTYSGFTVNKKITVRGSGQETMISGDVTIAIPGAVTLSSTVLENMCIGVRDTYGEYVNYNVKVTQPVDGLKIKQCRMQDISFANTPYYDVSVDRCYIHGTFSIPNAVKSMVVNNSAINELRPTEETTREISFVNCTVKQFYFFWGSAADNFRGSFINSVLGGGSSQHNIQSAVLIHTMLGAYNVSTSTYKENCYVLTADAIRTNYEFPTCIYTDDELMEKGYVGNDGTIIGCNGGATPYTLTPAVPVVTESDVKLDADKRELNVKLTLTAN